MHRLNQILAIEKGAKGRIHGEITRMHHQLQRPGLLNGFLVFRVLARSPSGGVAPPTGVGVERLGSG